MKQTKNFRFKADVSEEGSLKAVFSVFDIVDSDGDVVLSSAIKGGKEIPLVWSHDWSKPIGKGTIINDGKKATFDGAFFLDTSWGQDAYKTVKNMGDLQEYSWGFQVTEQEKGDKDGKVVNYIKATEEFEVSPVLIGANRETYTIDVKAEGKKFYADVEAGGSFEDLKDELDRAFREVQFGNDPYMGYSSVVATYEDHFVAQLWRWTDEEDTYWEVPYTKNDAGELELGDPKQVTAEVSFEPVPIAPSVTQTMSFDTHVNYVQAAVRGLIKRSNTGSELRRKEGRAISSARRESLEAVVTWMTDAGMRLQNLLDETAPEVVPSGKELYAQFLRIESELNGVKVRSE